MRFTELLVLVAVLASLMVGVTAGSRRSMELSERAIEAQRKAMCLSFVSESFRASCNGEGFSSLKEWQVACRAMYGLDYIGFGKADSFMEDSAALTAEENVPPLYYATWTGPYGTGEVYERRQKGVNWD